MTAEMITLRGPDGDFQACRAAPESGVGPAIIVIRGIFGISPVMRDICDGLAGKDKFVDAAARAGMLKTLEDHTNVTLHDYPEQDHAFAGPGGAHFDDVAANPANSRSHAFLQAHIGQSVS
jgi:dienelactone hydrolase